MRLFITTVQDGETLNEAIIRAGVTANELRFDGYEIVCEKCGEPIRSHENPTDCEIWLRARAERKEDHKI